VLGPEIGRLIETKAASRSGDLAGACGVGRAREDHVDRHAAVSQFLGQIKAHVAQRCLRRVVRLVARPGVAPPPDARRDRLQDAAAGPDDDDTAAPSLEHGGDEAPGHRQRSEDVDAQHRVPVLVRCLQDRREPVGREEVALTTGGVVDERVDPPEAVKGLLAAR